MPKFLYRTCAVVAPLVCAGGAILYSRGVALNGRSLLRERLSQPRELIAQPTNWLPFTADVRRVDEKSGEVRVGRFYRAADGSTRSETGPTLDAIDTIGIKNIASRKFYLWSQDRGWWTAQPMDLPQRGWRPTARVLTPNTSFIPDRVEGFDLVKTVMGSRIVYEA